MSIHEQDLGDGDDRFEALAEMLGVDRARYMTEAAERLAATLNGAPLWHINSTGRGGGVAELLSRVLPLYRGLGVDARWGVIDAPTEFFAFTKALGLAAYGDDALTGVLNEHNRRTYRTVGDELGRQFVQRAGSNAAVILHDHQTASMAPCLRRLGTGPLLWRCHVGVDAPNEAAAVAWDVLDPVLEHVDARIFSIPLHIPPPGPGPGDVVIPPVIEPTAPKHRRLTTEEFARLRGRLTGDRAGDRRHNVWSTPGFEWRPPIAVQVSRWDRLKDMHGLLDDFARSCPSGSLVLAGPDPSSIGDDPDQPKLFDRALKRWSALDDVDRRRIALLKLPMADENDNALLVNALQRLADVLVQRSLAEGFGLTVTEAMWKRKPVVASSVGGLRAQIEPDRSGLLVEPGEPFGPAIGRLFDDPALRNRLGEAARARVEDHYLPDTDIRRTLAVLETVTTGKPITARS